MSSSDL